MQQSNYVLLNQLRQDYEILKQIGSPLLACQGMLVPRGFEEARFLIKGSMRPIVSNGDPAEVQYAGGFTGIVPGIPNTKYSGTLQLIATESGHDQLFAEYITNTKGAIDCDYYDGRLDNHTAAYELLNCAIRFDQAEYDADSRSNVMTISCPCDYNYFGNFAKIGGNSTILPGKKEISGAQELINRVQNVVNISRQALDLTNQAGVIVGEIGKFF